MSSQTSFDRRQALRLAGLGTAALALPAWCGEARASPPLELGLETITIMNMLSDDMTAALAAARRVGYRVLQTNGGLGIDPSELADKMAAAGLRTDAQHLCPRSFYPLMARWSKGEVPMADVAVELEKTYALDRMPAVVEEGIATAKALGQKHLVWSSLPAADLSDAAGLSRIVRAFEAAGRLCAREGMVFGFHNGSKGFAPIAGRRPYDVLLEEVDPALMKMELDIYWAVKVGLDPIAQFKRHPGRYALCHLKNMGADGSMIAAGNGRIDFASIIPAARRAGVTNFYFEYDQAPDPIRNMTDALAYYTPMLTAKL